jgi:glucosamine-6-phosphate deaminase
MGIGTLRAARHILLMVSGAAKARALEAFLAGRPDPAWPVTALCGHPSVTLVADSALRVA